MGIPIIIYGKDSALSGSDPIILETSITSFLALPLTYGVGTTLSSSNCFLFFLLLTYKGACPKEKCSRVLILGLRAYFGRESLPRDPPRLPLRLMSSRHIKLDFYTLADKIGVLLLRYIKNWLLV
jgi:hypothetical protein